MIPFLKDFEVKFKDDPTKQRLGQILCAEIDSQITKNSPAYELMKACEYNYLGWSSYRRRGQRKNKPWPGACDFWSSLTEWTICAIVARIDSVLFSAEPTMTAIPTESNDVEQATEISTFMDMVMREIVELRKNIQFYFKQKIKQPLAIASFEWVYEQDIVREAEQGIVQEDLSIKLESGVVTPFDKLPEEVKKDIISGELLPGQTALWYVEKDKPISNQPKLKYISPQDYVWTNGTKSGQKPYLEGYRFWQTLNEINTKINHKEYTLTDEEKNKLKTTINAQAQTGDPINSRVIAERSYQFEGFKVFTRLPFNKNDEIDFDSSEALEQEVIVELSYKEKIVLKIVKWYYLRPTGNNRVFLRGFYEEKDTLTGNHFLGRSMTEKVEDINLLINKEFQQIVDNADIAMMKIFTKKRTILSEEWEEPEIFPGAVFDVEQSGDIQVLDVGDVKQINFQIIDSLLSFAARISNISPMNVSDRMEGSKPLATEIVNILKEGEIGREGIIQSCHEDLRQIYKMATDYYYQFMPAGLERRIQGDNAKLIFPPTPDRKDFQDDVSYNITVEQYEKQKFYEREMLIGIGKWDYKWNGTQLSGNREAQVAIADYLVEVLPKFQGLVTITGTWELLKDILLSRGKKDWQKYLVSKEKVDAEQQKMDVTAQAQDMQAGMPDLRDKLIAKGFPPEVVDMAIAKLNTKKGMPNEKPNNIPIK